jgi:hypothetical protein
VPLLRHEARARQAQIGWALHTGNDFVEVGYPFERGRTIEDRHGVFATEISGGRKSGKVRANDRDAGT